MKSPDPASLQNLNDIVLPARVDWWPLAGGWYVLFGLVLIVLAWLGFRFFRQWTSNRYRRAALIELQELEAEIDKTHEQHERDANLRKIPLLLKRAALSVFPRTEVASLSGQEWVLFLNSTVKNPSFTEVVSVTLNIISYSTGELGKIGSADVKALLGASRSWLKDHQVHKQPVAGGSH